MSVSVNGTNGLTFNDGSSQNTSAFVGGFAMRNRIINGAMMIDQRNAHTAPITLNGNAFGIDRWGTQASQNSKATMQQSSTVPTGFTNSLMVTSSSAYSSTSSDYFWLYQTIEGFNTADLNWGSASAQTVTLSFWVRASVTGTYSVRLGNGSRSYVSTYTVNNANTWEQKTVTVAGDQSGTWATTNGGGIQVQFDLGCGSTRTTSTTNAWQAGDYQKATGSVSLVANNAATLYITGVQLEKGSTATSFDYRPYGTELALCQRYYQQGVVASGEGYCASAEAISGRAFFKTTMRTTPTPTSITVTNSSNLNLGAGSGYAIGTADSVTIYQNSSGTGHTWGYWTFNVSSEL